MLSDLTEEFKKKLRSDKTAVLMIDTHNKNGIAEQRRLFIELINHKIKAPVIIRRTYENLSKDQVQLYASADIGSLLLDGLGDGVFICAENSGSDQMINNLCLLSEHIYP